MDGGNFATLVEQGPEALSELDGAFAFARHVCRKIFAQLMEWLRRRLRMKKMREWNKWKQLHKALRRRGYKNPELSIHNKPFQGLQRLFVYVSVKCP